VTVGNLDSATIEGDSELVRRLAMILLDNAIKFTPSGSEVRLSVFKSDGVATLVVEDSGIGIPADQLPHVFDRFYRGDPARVRSEGAGLGLSIARWIADAHRAQINVRSVEREGTRVEVKFPTSAVLSSS
jgi:signal transduction histidine kinase